MLLAVDGGNSKSDAVLFDGDGRILSHRRGPGSGGGPGHVANVIRDILDELVVDPVSISTAVVAVAGLDFPSDADRFESALGEVLPHSRIRAMNDAAAVLGARGTSDPALVLVCGAGMNAVAEGPAGLATVPAIDWMSGDRGGGEAIAREAVRLAYRGWDGRGSATVLSDAIPAAAGVRTPLELAQRLRDGLVDAATMNSFAPVTLGAAERGDLVAASIVAAAVDEAVSVALEATGRAWDNRRPDRGTRALLVGGLFQDVPFRDGVTTALTHAGFQPHPFAGSPVLGAATAAGLLADLPSSSIDRLRAGLTSASKG